MAQDDDVIEFFLALPPARRREYEALAELDRRFGEDVAAERRDEKTSGHDAGRRGGARGGS